MSLCPRDAPANRVTRPPTSAFPCEVCWLLFGCNGGRSASRPLCRCCSLAGLHHVRSITDRHWATMPPPTSVLHVGIFTSVVRVGLPGQQRRTDFPHSVRTDGRTFSCLLHAGWTGDNTLRVRRPNALPPYHFGPGDSAVAPVLSNDAHAQVSRVSIGSGFDTWPRFGSQPVFFVSRLPTLPFAKG
jgi:hypothetical protein